MNRYERITDLSLRLPKAGGMLETFTLSAPRDFPRKVQGPFNRVVFCSTTAA